MFQAKSGKSKARTIFLSLTLMSIIVISAFITSFPFLKSNAVCFPSNTGYVQSNNNDASCSTLTTASMSISSGHDLIVTITLYGTATNVITSISDTEGNTFTLQNSNGLTNTFVAIYFASSKSSSTDALTVTLSSSEIGQITMSGINCGKTDSNYGIFTQSRNFSGTGITCYCVALNIPNSYLTFSAISSNNGGGGYTGNTPNNAQWSEMTDCNNGGANFAGYCTSYTNQTITSGTNIGYTSGGANTYYSIVNLYYGTQNTIVTTFTQTITGWVFPNFIDGQQTFSWIYILGIVLFPVAFISELAYQDTKGGGINLDGKSPIFLTLISLFIGSVIGVFVNLIPVLFPFLIGIILAIYIWRGS